jgi:hypothetical protein
MYMCRYKLKANTNGLSEELNPGTKLQQRPQPQQRGLQSSGFLEILTAERTAWVSLGVRIVSSTNYVNRAPRGELRLLEVRLAPMFL